MKTVAAHGDVNDINTWSNIPYFFYRAGHEINLFNKAWDADVNKFDFIRKLWNLKEIMLLNGKGGFQYTKNFFDRIERQVHGELFSSDIVTFNQHFPRFKSVNSAGGSLYHYIDAPFLALLESNHYGISLPPKKAKRALQLEIENYKGSKAIVTMASWAKDFLLKRYDLDPGKIHTIMPGANIQTPTDFTFKETQNEEDHKTFKLGFIGKDWKRKGLDIVFEIAKNLSYRGYRIVIEVIGFAPKEMINDPIVNYHGFINKHTDQEKFIDIISSCDLGCVFSLDEAFGISTLEFLRLGVPVTGFLDKGLKDTIPKDAGIGFLPATSIIEMVEKIEVYFKNQDRLYDLRRNARKWSSYVTWERCVEEWKEKIFDGE